MPSDAIEGKRTWFRCQGCLDSGKLRGSQSERACGRKYTFFDACAGIGCFHLGMDKAGFDCVGAAEIDAGLQERYPKAFGLEPGRMFGDVSRITEAEGWDMHREGMQGHGRGRLPMHAMVEVRQPDREGPRRGHGLLGPADLMDEIGRRPSSSRT